MAKFLMMGKYSREAIQGISSERTQKAKVEIERCGGEVDSIYALMGNYDLAMLVEFPTANEAMKASVALTEATGISFTTMPAVDVKEFDRMMD